MKKRKLFHSETEQFCAYSFLHSSQGKFQNPGKNKDYLPHKESKPIEVHFTHNEKL